MESKFKRFFLSKRNVISNANECWTASRRIYMNDVFVMSQRKRTKNKTVHICKDKTKETMIEPRTNIYNSIHRHRPISKIVNLIWHSGKKVLRCNVFLMHFTINLCVFFPFSKKNFSNKKKMSIPKSL